MKNYGVMFYHDHQQQRSRRSLVGRISTYATVAYGTYRIACWALETWQTSDPDTPTTATIATTTTTNGNNNNNNNNKNNSENNNNTNNPQCNDQNTRHKNLNSNKNHSKFDKYKHKKTRRMRIMEQKQHRKRLQQCRKEVRSAIFDLLPSLRSGLVSRCDASFHVEALKVARDCDDENDVDGDGDGDSDGKDGKDEKENRMVIRQQEHWNAIRDAGMVHALSTAYAHVLLFLVLQVQVHLLGGRLKREEMEEQSLQRENDEDEDEEEEEEEEEEEDVNESSEDEDDDNKVNLSECHGLVLRRTYERFFSDGMNSLVESISDAFTRAVAAADSIEGEGSDNVVKTNVENIQGGGNENDDDDDDDSEDIDGGWNVTTSRNMSFTKFNACIDRVRNIVEGYGIEQHRSLTSPTRGCLVRFLVPPDDDDDDDDGDGEGAENAPINTATTVSAASILDETWDILEGPVWAEAERECLDITFNAMRDGGWGGIFRDGNECKSSSRGIPLAHIVTKLRKVVALFHDNIGGDTMNDNGTNNDDQLAQSDDIHLSYPNSFVVSFERSNVVRDLADISFY